MRVEFGRYINGGAAAIELACTDEESSGESWPTASVNVPGVPEGHVAVKNWFEGEGIVELLRAAGVIEGEAVTHIASDYVSIPVFRLLAEALEALKLPEHEAG